VAAPICSHATSTPDDFMNSCSAFSPSRSWPAGTASSTVDQPCASLPLMSLPSLTRRLTVVAAFANARSRTPAGLPRPACAAVSGMNTLPDLPASRATFTSPSVWRSSHAFFDAPFITLANRTYLANPAEPATTTSPPPRVTWADRRLSTSEYTARSGPRAAAFSGGLGAGLASAVLPVEPGVFAALGALGAFDFPGAPAAADSGGFGS